MISIKELSNKIQENLNKGQDLFKFWLVTDTAKFKRASRDKNDITEYVNGLFNVNTSDASTLNNGNLVSTLNCSLKIIMRMKGFDDDVYSTPEAEGETPTLITLGDLSRIQIMREYLDRFFQGNTFEEMSDAEDASKKYVVSAVYDLSQSGVRGQVERVGDSYTFTANIYYVIVQQGINSRSAVFTLDNFVIPYQSVTTYRTPTMDGNVYADTKDGSTKNLSSQSTFSISFELPALLDETTSNMLDFLFNGELNQAHFLTKKVGEKTKSFLVAYGEIKLIGQTVENLGQNLSLVECPTDYDLIHFNDKYFVYEANIDGITLDIKEGQAYLFGSKYNGFINNTTVINYGDKVVSLVPIDALERV